MVTVTMTSLMISPVHTWICWQGSGQRTSWGRDWLPLTTHASLHQWQSQTSQVQRSTYWNRSAPLNHMLAHTRVYTLACAHTHTCSEKKQLNYTKHIPENNYKLSIWSRTRRTQMRMHTYMHKHAHACTRTHTHTPGFNTGHPLRFAKLLYIKNCHNK